MEKTYWFFRKQKAAAPRCALHDTNHSFIDLFSNIAVNGNAQLVINLSFVICVYHGGGGVGGTLYLKKVCT